MGSLIHSPFKHSVWAVLAALLAGLGFVDRASAACSYTITPADRTHGFGATTATVSVATSSGCNWSVVNNASWITILSATSGTGNKEVTYALAGNPNPGTRQAVLQIAGKNFTVTQTGVLCTYEISPTFHNKCPNSSTGSVQVSTPSPCAWTVSSPVNWILITDGENSVGSGKVYFTVLENTEPAPRTAVLTIAGLPFTINQAAYTTLTCAPDKQVECGSDWTFDAPAGQGSAPIVASTVTNLICGGAFVATRVWSFNDLCGNAGTCTQAVTVVDTTPPVLVCAPNATVNCSAVWSFGAPVATDACDPASPTLQILSTVTNQNSPCSFSATRTWRALDACGNASACSQTVTMVDMTPPTISCAGDKSAECGTPWTFDPPAAIDACSAQVALQVVDTLTNSSGFCGGTFKVTRTWSATDSCGNASTCSQTVTLVDTRPPTISCAGNKSAECGTAWTFDAPSAADACSADVALQVVNTLTNRSGSCGGTFSATRTWSATDSCGNASTCSQTVTVVDTRPPTMTCAGNKIVECGAGWAFDTPVAVDACGTTSVQIVSTVTNRNGFCEGSFITTRTWIATDGCNLSTCNQTVTVVDTTPPALTCAPNKSAECGAFWMFDPPTAIDDCSAAVSIQIVSTVTNSGLCAGASSATRTWSATDGCGNAIACSQTVTVVDTTPPTILCVNDKNAECGTPWSFDAPTANDSCSTSVTIQIQNTTTNRTGFCGDGFSATRTWKATDGCGNSAICSQTVGVVDTQAPQLSCAPDRAVPCGTTWDFTSPAVIDLCDGTNVQLRVVSTVTNGNCGQTLTATRLWEAEDRCGNKAACSQTVTVEGLPLEIVCAPDRSVHCADLWTFDAPTVRSGCGAVTRLVGTITNRLCGQAFTATRLWEIGDGCTNVPCQQTINVVDNPPVVVCAWNRLVSCEMPWEFEEPQVLDDCGYEIRIVSTTTNLLCGPSYTATRQWEVTDGCTNISCSQTVEVLDQTPPTIVCPPNITVTNLIDVPHCAKSFTEFVLGGGQASDTCDTFRYRCIEGSLVATPCGYTIERLHTVIDNCGNSNGCVQLIIVCETALPRPVLAEMNILATGGIKLKITGPPGQTYNVLRGTEIGQPWNVIGTVTLEANGSVEFVDPTGISGVCRIYQLVKP